MRRPALAGSCIFDPIQAYAKLPRVTAKLRRRQDMPGYWIVRASALEDQEAFDEYVRRWPIVAQRVLSG